MDEECAIKKIIVFVKYLQRLGIQPFVQEALVTRKRNYCSSYMYMYMYIHVLVHVHLYTCTCTYMCNLYTVVFLAKWPYMYSECSK